MTDFFHLSDAQFLAATAPLEADTPTHMIRCTCGNVFEAPLNVTRKRCPQCAETRTWSEKDNNSDIPHGTIRR